MYSLIIFDWDGTVINSTAKIVASMQAAASDVGLSLPSDDVVRNIIGLGLPEAILMMFPKIKPEQMEPMKARYAYHYVEQNHAEATLFPLAKETLEALKQKGYRLAVATGKSRRGLDRVLDETGLAHLFEITRCADETTSKPHPHMLNEILAETGVAAEHAIMVGDTEYDLEMGERAGMGCIAVTYGAHAPERLHPYNPLFTANQFEEIGHWLCNQEVMRER
jgi:phosphoglycolate phosphatase